MSSFVGYLDTNASTSCVNTRTTNLIDVIRDIKINLQGKIDENIPNNEYKFLNEFYNVNLYRYVLISNELLDTYLSEIQELTEKEQTYTRTVNHKDKDTGEVSQTEKTYTKPFVEIKQVPDTTNNHQIYIIKNVLIKDMIATFRDPSKGGDPELKIYVVNNKPRLVREKKDKEKKEKPEKPHVEGRKVAKKPEDNKDENKDEPKKTTAKKAAATPAKKAAAPAKKAPTKGKKKEEPDPEPDPEEAGEEGADEEIDDEEPADE